MKRIILLIIFLACLGATALGQVARIDTQHGTGVPASSVCTAGNEYVDDATGNLYTYKSGTGCILSGNTAAGTGNVAGPGSATANDVPLLDATGKVLSDSGKAFSTDGTLASNSDAKVPTEKAVKTYADSKVPQTTTVNGKALSSSITLNCADLGDTTTVGSNLCKATNPSAISFPKIAADNSVSFRTPSQVKTDLSLVASDVGLGSVTNDAQTKAAIVPNTAPSAGQTLCGNAGGTAYAPCTVGTDATLSSAGALTLASVISAGGPTGSATVVPIITYDAKGRLTTVSSATITPAVGSVTGLGTGVATALGVNVGSAGAFVTFNGAGGTPSSITLTNGSGLPLSGLATQATNTVVGNSTSGTASPTALAVGSCSTSGSALIWTTNTGFGCNTSIAAASVTGFTAGAGTLTGPASAGVAETLGNNETITGIKTFSPTARSSGANAYLTINIPADTAQTAATESPGFKTVTATRQWASTGTVALQRENFFAGPTYSSASASQTFTDAFTLYATPPIAGTNAIFTRGHTLGIVDSTSAASAVTGGFVVCTTLGTAAGCVGIGGGNINAGGTLTVGGGSTLSGALTYGGVTLSNAVTGTGNMVLSADPLFSGVVHNGSANTYGRLAQELELTTSANFGGMAVNTFSTSATQYGTIDFNRSKSASIGTFTALASGDTIGAMFWRGADGSAFQTGASIYAQVDAATGAGSMPTSLILATTPSGSSTATDRWKINSAGGLGGISAGSSIITYKNVTTAGYGVPVIYGSGRSAAQTGAVASVATYTNGAADGTFEVSANVLVTTSTTHNFTVTCAYTDEGNTARTITFTFSNVGGTLLTAIINTGGAVPYEGVPLHIRVKASTAITIATSGTFTSVVYNVEGIIKQMS